MSNRLGVIYARQSSGKDEESESIQMQIEKCQELATESGIHIIATYYDTDTSARTYPIGAEAVAELDLAFQEWFYKNTLSRKYRPGLGNVLAWLPRIDCILVYDVTRLYRPLQHSFLQGYIDAKLVANHIRIITCTEGESDPGKFSDNLVSSIRSSVNDNQIQLTSEKSRLALRKLRDAGYYPNAPKMYGIRYLGGKDRVVAVIPAEAEMVRFVFQQALSGRSYHGIVREMNRRFTVLRRGKCFHLSTLRNILSNPIYCGRMYDSNHNLINCNQIRGIRDMSKRQYLQDPSIILENRLAEEEYARLLRLAIQRITIFGGYILVKTAEKVIRLDRVLWHRSKIFPKFKVRVNRDQEGLAKKVFVHYRYPNGGEMKVVAVF